MPEGIECQNCGVLNSSDRNYCSGCGEPISAEAMAAAERGEKLPDAPSTSDQPGLTSTYGTKGASHRFPALESIAALLETLAWIVGVIYAVTTITVTALMATESGGIALLVFLIGLPQAVVCFALLQGAAECIRALLQIEENSYTSASLLADLADKLKRSQTK